MMPLKKTTLLRYIRYRLGPGDDFRLLAVMLKRSFGAGTLTAFWQYWNPVYGYYLYRLCYRPLRKFLPRPVCVVATFAVCGYVLHDLPVWGLSAVVAGGTFIPFVTIWFVIIGCLVALAEAMKLDFAKAAFGTRVFVHLAHIGLPFF